jgi:hypothetical protein
MNVDCKGKSRGVTVNSADCLFLEPVHKAIYDRLSRFSWLLRGEAKPASFSSFGRRDGELFVSGDYSAATDNLSLEVAELLLVSIFSRARSIPVPLQLECLRSLRANVWYDNCGVAFVQTRGQLMGSFLSFPLLCLQNYCAFKFVVHRPVPVKINGDDIVFRSTRLEYERWLSFCPQVGLFVCPGKTMVHERYFSLNSTFFKARLRDVKLLPVVRMATLSEPPQCPASLAGGFYSFRKGWKFKEVVDGTYLSRRRKAIVKSGRSLRALGIKVGAVGPIQEAGLWRRELWFQGVKESRLPPSPGKVKWAPLPEGWERVPLARSAGVRRRQEKTQDSFWDAVIEGAWSGGVIDKNVQLRDHWDESARTGCHGAYLDFKARSKKYSRSPLMRRHFYRFELASPGCPFSEDNQQVLVGSNPYELRLGERLRGWLFGVSPARGRLVWSPKRQERVGPVAFVFGHVQT